MDRQRFAGSPVGHLAQFSGTDGRTGQRFDHVAFVADPLREEPQFLPSTWHAVGAARAAVARLDSLAAFVPDARLLRTPTLRREAQSTSALEGTFAPLEDVVSARSGSTESRSSELSEVLNYVTAAEFVFDAVASGAAVSVGLVASAQKALVAGTSSDGPDAGRVRRGPVVIGSPTGAVEDARFVPMPAGTALEVAARDLFDWIRTSNDRRIDPVVACAMAHYQFEAVHPFNDGNGRLGRLLIVVQLMTGKLLREPLLSVSPWFETRRSEYQDRLAAVSATGDWDGWVQFFASGLADSALDTVERIGEMLAAHRQYAEWVAQANLGGVARQIIDCLLEQPIITAPELVARTGRSTGAVYGTVKKLVDIGVLQGPFGTYNRFYVADEIWTAPPETTLTGDACVENSKGVPRQAPYRESTSRDVRRNHGNRARPHTRAHPRAPGTGACRSHGVGARRLGHRGDDPVLADRDPRPARLAPGGPRSRCRRRRDRRPGGVERPPLGHRQRHRRGRPDPAVDPRLDRLGVPGRPRRLPPRRLLGPRTALERGDAVRS